MSAEIKAPGPAVYQAAIAAIHEIRETQILEKGGNCSRDLYPFRAIITAIDAPKKDDERLTDIKKALQDHRDYPRQEEQP
jgi:hypothetical protein